ncbi:Guanylate kinase [Ruminococcus sp. YRD2003]|uniref:guanylate kinase n=1 Tax=Ruminococcus sp. YRD2003 TaxID=1452313 RepID=UPI0008BBDF08|nr:Guanylate kinase [Ruminococcus flavefaciens]
MNRIFCIMGKSSSGKDSLYSAIIGSLALTPLVIYTTRPMRENEKDGREYHFVDRETFEKMSSEGRVIESRTYNTKLGDWTYFTANDNIDLDSHSYAVIGTLESFVPIRDYFGADRVVPLYVEVEDGERLARAVERERREEEPKFTELCRRFIADTEDFSDEKLAAAGVERRFDNTGSFNECLNEMKKYILSFE